MRADFVVMKGAPKMRKLYGKARGIVCQGGGGGYRGGCLIVLVNKSIGEVGHYSAGVT
jgi:hypothetical protein